MDKLHHIKIRFFYLTGDPVKDMSLNVSHLEGSIMMMPWYLIHEEYFYNSKIKHNLLKRGQNITTTTLKKIARKQTRHLTKTPARKSIKWHSVLGAKEDAY